MDTSDHQRAPDKPAPDQPEPESNAVPAPAEPLPEPSPDDAGTLLPDEADAIEQAHFEMLERETTQPVRPYSYVRPDPNPAVTEAEPELVTEPEPEPEPEPVEDWRAPPPPAEPPQASRPFEPAPFSVPPQSDRPEPVIPQRLVDPSPVLSEPIEPEPVPEPATFDPPPPDVFEARPASPAFDPPPEPPEAEVTAPPVPGYEAPQYDAPAPSAPTDDFPHWQHPADAPASFEPEPPAFSPIEPERDPEPAPPPSHVEPTPQPEPAPVAYQPHVAPRPPLTLDNSRWELRREPSFEAYVAPQPSLTAVADIAPPADAAGTRRDWRDLARRAFSVALIVFAGWLAAVMLLIVVYRFVNPPFSMLMAQRFVTGTMINKQWVPIDRISPNLSRAVIVAEDGRFCQHWGVDFIEAANAIRRSSTAYPRGASTITMQVAKNLFLLPTKSYLRKMVEIPLTFAIELVWPKRRILEVYLNIVEWGPGIFGAEAASRAHFRTSAAGLSSRQAAQLAAVLPNPIIRNAGAPGRRTANKASVVQARAAQAPEASACVYPRR